MCYQKFPFRVVTYLWERDIESTFSSDSVAAAVGVGEKWAQRLGGVGETPVYQLLAACHNYQHHGKQHLEAATIII